MRERPATPGKTESSKAPLGRVSPGPTTSSPVPGFDDWKRQFMQAGEPLNPTLGPENIAKGKLAICPRCYSDRTRPATLTRLDGLFRLAGYYPHRCRACSHRFYKRGATDGPLVDSDTPDSDAD